MMMMLWLLVVSRWFSGLFSISLFFIDRLLVMLRLLFRVRLVKVGLVLGLMFCMVLRWMVGVVFVVLMRMLGDCLFGLVRVVLVSVFSLKWVGVEFVVVWLISNVLVVGVVVWFVLLLVIGMGWFMLGL